MNQTAAVWLVVLLAFAAANLPFATNRLFAVIRLKQPKSLALRLLEMLIGYLIVGGIGLFFEQQAGQIAPQKWEFYAITATLFITFAFPGFIYRYLFKRRSDAVTQKSAA
jgi:ABC-type microcin C transport system permease subunit YejB